MFHLLRRSLPFRHTDRTPDSHMVLGRSLHEQCHSCSSPLLRRFVALFALDPFLWGSGSVSLVTDALFSFRQLPKSKWSFLGWKLPSMEYGITIACIVVAIAWSPFAGIFTGRKRLELESFKSPWGHFRIVLSLSLNLCFSFCVLFLSFSTSSFLPSFFVSSFLLFRIQALAPSLDWPTPIHISVVVCDWTGTLDL